MSEMQLCLAPNLKPRLAPIILGAAFVLSLATATAQRGTSNDRISRTSTSTNTISRRSTLNSQLSTHNSQRPISFVNDVIPVLTRAGCNSGTCHGAAVGKNGFKLSLRGYAPELDH